ncbi:S-layer homology domain-containing protein [Candidatus Agathobaculum pullicola]|uniref:S-layer homology domain-containing protein n=1 Tax=Candidatus Agathobaculum pullicola TaxID=2838426 RepID=UPI003F8EA5A8
MKCKRILSMLLTLCMVMSLFAGTTVTASAASATEVSTWSELQTAFMNGGDIQLTTDITAGDSDSALTVPSRKTVTLDLNGHTIDRKLTSLAAKAGGNVIKVSGTLIINDSAGKGTITGGNCSSSQFLAGAVCVLSDGSFTLNGGSICGNKTSGSNCGTGVAVSDRATFIMNGGSICENVGTGSDSNGGGVGAESGSTVKLLGGRIEKNTVSGSSGGGLMFYSNKVTVGGSIVIKDNTAKQKTNNVKSSSKYLRLSEERPLTNEAEIGWTLNTRNSQPSETGTLVAKGKNAAQYVDNFFSDQDSSYIIGVKENESDAIYIATANSTVVAKPSARKVEITAGQHMTKTQDSGNASQTVTASAITDIVYTADTGHYFPENYVSTISNLTDGALNGITVTRNSDSTITVSGTPTADTTITLKDAAEISEPTFNDGFGNANITSGSYTVDNEYAVGSGKYVFAGWYASADYSGDAVTEFTNGTTYYAKWTKNGKTVRTTGLDLTKISESNTLGAKYDNGVYVNTAEGWTWMPGDNGGTLLLENCTIDVPGVADSAVSLPNGATLTTAANTQNTLSNVSTGSIEALWGEGAVTITGSGSLSLSGYEYGLSAGEITINAPITMIATNKQNGTAVAGSSITINSALSITEPSGGQIRENDGFHYIADRNGKFATNVVIGVAAPTFNDGLGKVDCAFDTYTKGATNDKGYTFAGWFNGETELTSADVAVAGTTYTAKWTKNGKTVRTAPLDFYDDASDEWQTGCTQNGTLWTNDAEGWSWDTASRTLTLNGVTIDTQLDGNTYAAIGVFGNATIETVGGTENFVCSRSEDGENAAIFVEGDLAIIGNGKLTVVGEEAGIYAEGDIAINAPITATSTGTSKGCGAILAEGHNNKVEIKIDSSLSIVTPADGRTLESEGVAWIAAGNNEEPVSNVVIGVAKKYTVTYNTNGGSAVGSATVSEGGKLTEPQAPTKDGYTFHGWYKDAAFTNGWNFDADTVTGDLTLYAKWAETAKTYGISGTVYEYGGTTSASGVTVKLMKGDTQVASTTSATDGTGTYRFTGIAPGVYNIVAEKGDVMQTTLVIITNQNETNKNITMPDGNVNSKLTVSGADTPDVVAGGLAEESAAVKAANSSAISVKVEMTVESKSSAAVNTSDKTKIEAVASGKTLEYLDIKVTKTVDGTDSAITTTANMMEIVIPYDMTGKSNITVYRNHDGVTEAFAENTTKADGTYYLDTVNHLIYVYTQKFSTYAIGYNTQSGGGSGSGGSSSSSGSSSSGNSSTISTPSAKNGTVSVSPKSASKGTTVTVTVTPDKGYVLETLTVTDASGKKLDLKNLGSGKYSFTMPASKVEVKATFMEDNTMLNYFVDIPASAYYYDAVLWAAEQGITGGTDATHFSPDGVCTRAQAVTFLWRAAGSPASSATAMPFTDVAADSYYYNAVLWAMENGITVGTSSTTFSPDLKCSRAHIMTFLWRSEKSPAAGSVNPFTDVSADAYYADAVLWAVKESVTNGTSSATFSPDADCTRAQIVTFIWRTLTR